jgi:hypothetical protein
MATDLDELEKMPCGTSDGIWRRDANTVEAERARFLRQRASQIAAAQKSSST